VIQIILTPLPRYWCEWAFREVVWPSWQTFLPNEQVKKMSYNACKSD
jgi:hypothetical protein